LSSLSCINTSPTTKLFGVGYRWRVEKWIAGVLEGRKQEINGGELFKMLLVFELSGTRR